VRSMKHSHVVIGTSLARYSLRFITLSQCKPPVLVLASVLLVFFYSITYRRS
jgi:hypothetical protein